MRSIFAAVVVALFAVGCPSDDDGNGDTSSTDMASTDMASNDM